MIRFREKKMLLSVSTPCKRSAISRILIGVCIILLSPPISTVLDSTLVSAETSTPAHLKDCYDDLLSDSFIPLTDPCATDSCSVTSSVSTVAMSMQDGDLSKVVDYKNRPIFTDAELTAIRENKPFYEKAAEKQKIPWEMLAVTHYRESRLKRYNLSNGQGVYQDYERYGAPTPGKDYPTGPVDDTEFQRQTDWAAKFLKDKAKTKNIDMTAALESGDDNAVKFVFFGYNGRAGVYIQQAKTLGYSDEEAQNGEGSPYVMNKADEKRDPGTNPKGWGQIKRDGGSIQYPANQDHGAFVMYAALRGKIAADGSACTVNDSGDATAVPGGAGNLQEGGLTEEQARRFMMNYGANKNGESVKAMNSSPYGKPGTGCSGGALSNCVSFSAFFMNKFTNMKHHGGNGNRVVRNLAAAGIPTGTEPKVFAVFSNGFGTPAGHTGVILGIHGDQMVVGHASCSNPGSGRGDGLKSGGGAGFVKVGTVSTGALLYRDRPTFAYPSSVDTAAIEAFMNQ